MPTFNNWLTALFVKDEDVATAHEVAAGQAAILDRQHRAGLVNEHEFINLSREIDLAGDELDTFKQENQSLAATIPWWVAPLLLVLAFVWMFGLPNLRRRQP